VVNLILAALVLEFPQQFASHVMEKSTAETPRIDRVIGRSGHRAI
jgi:hypothetical protein